MPLDYTEFKLDTSEKGLHLVIIREPGILEIHPVVGWILDEEMGGYLPMIYNEEEGYSYAPSGTCLDSENVVQNYTVVRAINRCVDIVWHELDESETHTAESREKAYIRIREEFGVDGVKRVTRMVAQFHQAVEADHLQQTYKRLLSQAKEEDL